MVGTRSTYRCLTFHVLLILSLCHVKFSQASDTLLPNQRITGGQTLISANKTFQLGFFSPQSSSNYYLGIWYYNIPTCTVVWVANRDTPLMDSSGFLMIDGEGNLMIKDSRGSSIKLSYGSRANLTQAKLLDWGNFILEESNTGGKGSVLWESFDNPTDTFLPGMKLGMIGRQNRLISSWTSTVNPASGTFSLGTDPNGTNQFFIWQRGYIFWASGVWNGEIFQLVPEMTSNYTYNFGFVSNGNGDTFIIWLKILLSFQGL